MGQVEQARWGGGGGGGGEVKGRRERGVRVRERGRRGWRGKGGRRWR